MNVDHLAEKNKMQVTQDSQLTIVGPWKATNQLCESECFDVNYQTTLSINSKNHFKSDFRNVRH